MERYLSVDAVDISVQNACLRGVLYLTEDPGSAIVPLIGGAVGKYITTHLKHFSRSVSGFKKVPSQGQTQDHGKGGWGNHCPSPTDAVEGPR